MAWVRHPSLEDYDAGRHLLHWAEYVAARAHAPYDEVEPCEIVPATRSAKEAAADANAAQARYEAHRERTREIEAEAKKHAARLRAEQAKRAQDQAAEQKERQRVAVEEQAWRTAAAVDAEARLERWLREQVAWEAERVRQEEIRQRVESVRLQTQKALAFQFEQWGTGFYVEITKDTSIRWNGYPADFAQRVVRGTVWHVGKPLAMTIVANNCGRLLDG